MKKCKYCKGWGLAKEHKYCIHAYREGIGMTFNKAMKHLVLSKPENKLEGE